MVSSAKRWISCLPGQAELSVRLAVSVRLAKRRCLAFAPPPSSPGCDGPKREDKSETEETCSADSRRCSGPSATPRPPVHGDFFLGPSYTYLIACVRTPPFSSAVRNLTWVTARVQKQR